MYGGLRPMGNIFLENCYFFGNFSAFKVDFIFKKKKEISWAIFSGLKNFVFFYFCLNFVVLFLSWKILGFIMENFLWIFLKIICCFLACWNFFFYLSIKSKILSRIYLFYQIRVFFYWNGQNFWHFQKIK